MSNQPYVDYMRARQVCRAPAWTRQGPVGFAPDALPIPCAYIKLPWPLSRKIARLLPPARENNGLLELHRQYIKRMMVEEVCVDPPSFILRYCHYAECMDLNESRLSLFQQCRDRFPNIQVMSLQHQSAEFDGGHGDTLGSTKLCVINQHSPEDKVFAIHHLVENWRNLPLSYAGWESIWVQQIVPRIAQYFVQTSADNVPAHASHLAVVLDCSVFNRDWTPHCMRLIIHMIAQIVSVAHSTIPLYLRPGRDADRMNPSNQSYGFSSFQIIVLPPSKFNEGVAVLRVKNELQYATQPPNPASRYSADQHILRIPRSPNSAYETDGTVISHISQKIVSGKSTRGRPKPFCGFNASSEASADQGKTTSSMFL